MIEIGPTGIGGVNEAISNLENYAKFGFKASEVAFTYNVYIKKDDAIEIGKWAKTFGISLSIHASYYINLVSDDKKKIEASKKRILKCCEIGHYLGAKYIVFHAAFYGNYSKEKCYELVQKEILDLQKIIERNKLDVVLCPETTGKLSQFGTIEELVRLSKETKCGICIDFAHLYARGAGRVDYNYICRLIKGIKYKTAHFSGINYGERGELNHMITPKDKIKELLKNLLKYKINIRIINESPDPIGDSLKTKIILDKLQ